MNFKILVFLFLLSSCGVKSPPLPPEGTITPSYTDKYLLDENSTTDQEKKVKAQNP